jgi:beta-N-acetylhexosaminidase
VCRRAVTGGQRIRRRLSVVQVALAALVGLALLSASCAVPSPAALVPVAGEGRPTTVPPRLVAAADPCVQRAAALPLRTRLAQRLMIGVDPSGPAEAVAAARETVGGIFIGGNPTGLLADGALAKVQAAATVPVAVAVDDEGGRVQRIDALDGSLPSARQMATTMSPDQVRELATTRGKALRARGVTMNFAPVADLTDQPANAVIGDRSFGSNPAAATPYAAAFAAGLRQGGVLPVLKHFPGHGRADGDSHRQLVRTPPLQALAGSDLLPYRDLVDDGPVGVMVGHLNVPGLTGGEPATLSPAAYRLLRTEYRHDGLVVTDDLGAMRAITERYSLPQAVLGALQAGADVALWTTGGRLGEVLDRLERAVSTGELATVELDRAVGRVLAAKGAC